MTGALTVTRCASGNFVNKRSRCTALSHAGKKSATMITETNGAMENGTHTIKMIMANGCGKSMNAMMMRICSKLKLKVLQ